ncbi:ThiF family adenylyltransferase [bacterium]|nr:ThiF family adenylyltransferase [bacterium]MBU1652727.1 ThiF family adenylyltransferase [bacterium]MBU1882063.1 ThiF family adenylyltransferase [bacterium]
MEINRYARLQQLTDIGEAGLRKLHNARIALVGCGTLGSLYAINLTRMGIGYLRLIDRDIVEPHNLGTQFLYNEFDAAKTRPKALAAKQHLEPMNADCHIEAVATSISAKTAPKYLYDVDLIVDATDNFDTRFIINDLAVRENLPWLYTGVVGYFGVTTLIKPQETACLHCLISDPPSSGELPTCETEGVWPPAAQTITAFGLKELTNFLVSATVSGVLHTIDFQADRWTHVQGKRQQNCPTCVQRDFKFIDGKNGYSATSLCGREMVHILPDQEKAVDLPEIAKRLSHSFKVMQTEDLLRVKIPEGEIYLFADGRALIKGVNDVERARSLYDRYIGS